MHRFACLLIVALLAASAGAQTMPAPSPPPAGQPAGAALAPVPQAELDALRSKLDAQKQKLDEQYKAMVDLEAEIAKLRMAGADTGAIEAKLARLKALEAAYEKDKNAYEIEAARYQLMIVASGQGQPATALAPTTPQAQPPAQEQARLESLRQALEKERLALEKEKQALDKDSDLATKNSAKAKAYQKQLEAFNEKVSAFGQKRQQFVDAVAAHNAKVAKDRETMEAAALTGPPPAAVPSVPPPPAAGPATQPAPAGQPAPVAAAQATPAAGGQTRQQLDEKGKALDAELQTLMKERAEVETLVKEAKTPEQGQAANYRAFDLNQKIKDFEQRRNAFNAEANGFNAAQPRP